MKASATGENRGRASCWPSACTAVKFGGGATPLTPGGGSAIDNEEDRGLNRETEFSHSPDRASCRPDRHGGRETIAE